MSLEFVAKVQFIMGCLFIGLPVVGLMITSMLNKTVKSKFPFVVSVIAGALFIGAAYVGWHETWSTVGIIVLVAVVIFMAC